MLVTLKSVMTQSLNSYVVNERKCARLQPVIVRNKDSIVPTSDIYSCSEECVNGGKEEDTERVELDWEDNVIADLNANFN